MGVVKLLWTFDWSASLQATGKLEKFLEKRRRKNAAKDHRYLPYRRPESNQD